MRFGIIGCGWAGAVRADALKRAGGMRLVAVSDLDGRRANELAAKHGAAVEADWRALIYRKDIDAVIVSTPPPLHLEMCVSAFGAGLHVLCEKPLARNPYECRAIIDAATRARKVLATGFNYRFYPAIIKAKEIVGSGVIGDLDHIRSFAGHPGSSEFTNAWVHDHQVMGGGAFMDNGIHILDLTCYFLGSIAEAKGFATNGVWKFDGCEDNGFALLKNNQGRVATVQASWTEWRGYRWALEIFGTRGCVRAAYPPMQVETCIQAENGKPLKRKDLFPGFQVKEKLRSPRWTAQESMAMELAEMAKAVRGEGSQNASGLDGLRAVQIAHATYSEQSVRIGDNSESNRHSPIAAVA